MSSQTPPAVSDAEVEALIGRFRHVADAPSSWVLAALSAAEEMLRRMQRDRQTAEARSAAGVEWQPIETAPKTDANRVVYILIGDGVCLPDIVTWRPRRPARTDEYGTFRHAVPEGWFLCGGGRSRLDGRATCWASVPNYLPTPPAGGADDAG